MDIVQTWNLIFWLVGTYVAINVIAHAMSRYAYRRWQRTVDWDENGLMPSAREIEKGEGEDAVLFVHGFNDVPATWSRWVDFFADRGFKCLAMRLPGAGHRGLCDEDSRRLRHLLKLQLAVSEKVNYLARSHRRVFLVGHSLGGALAADALYRHNSYKNGNSPIASAFLLAPLVKVSSKRSFGVPLRLVYTIVYIVLPMLYVIPSVFREYMSVDDGSGFTYRRDHFNDKTWVKTALRGVTRMGFIEGGDFGAPMAILAADNDRVVDTSAIRSWAGKAKSAVQYREVRSDTHALHLSANWSRFAEDAIAFFRHQG